MDTREQTNAFSADLARLIRRYQHEFDLPYVNAIGVLHMHATMLTVACKNRLDEERADKEDGDGGEG